MGGNGAKRGGGGASKAAGGGAITKGDIGAFSKVTMSDRDKGLDQVQSIYEAADSKLTKKYYEAVKNGNEKLANEISSAKQDLQTKKWNTNEKIQSAFQERKAAVKAKVDVLRDKANAGLAKNNQKVYESNWDKIYKLEANLK